MKILIALLLILYSTTAYNMTYNCNGKFDVVFLMDGSGRFENLQNSDSAALGEEILSWEDNSFKNT
jgi:hypothetical protein